MKMRDRIRKGLLNRRGVEFAYLFSFVGFVVYSKRRANHVFFFCSRRKSEREREIAVSLPPLFNNKCLRYGDALCVLQFSFCNQFFLTPFKLFMKFIKTKLIKSFVIYFRINCQDLCHV